MPHADQWARTRVRTSRHVRRGAWYRVIRATALEGVLEVNRRQVTVPRSFLQILPFRPTTWSVITRLPNAQHPPASWGSTYGVCPSCSARAPLGQHAARYVRGATGCFRWRGKIRGCVCLKQPNGGTALLASEGALPD